MRILRWIRLWVMYGGDRVQAACDHDYSPIEDGYETCTKCGFYIDHYMAQRP